MSDTLNNEAPKLTVFEQLRVQHAQFVAQREAAQTNLNQLVGAIFACELMLKNHEECEKRLEQNKQENNPLPVEPDHQQPQEPESSC